METSTEKVAFKVDTSLFKQLGELLVGRDSTAVVELIKNAYDADATEVKLFASLASKSSRIIVSDNGTGMDAEGFVDRFLRIGGRSRTGKKPYSGRFRRRFTGAKGIGRLSAHKLSRVLEVESSMADEPTAFRATIRWDDLEESQQSIESSELIEVVRATKSGDGAGTTLTFTDLRSPWTPSRIRRFVSELRSARVDDALATDVSDRLGVDLMLPVMPVADTQEDDPGLAVEYGGDLAETEPQWPGLLSRISWVLEIDARSDTVVKFRVSPSDRLRRTSESAVAQEFEQARSPGPWFTARVLIRSDNARMPDLLEQFSREVGGIRIFQEGFRVLPYGAPDNDWLGINASTSRRQSLTVEDVLLRGPKRADVDERTYQLQNANHYGAVFLQEKNSSGLEMVINREGFLPGTALDQVAQYVRLGIDLATRMRANLALLEERNRSSQGGARSPFEPRAQPTPYEPLATDSSRLSEAADSLRGLAESADPKIREVVNSAANDLASAAAEVALAADEATQLRILSGLGLQLSAFVHEVNSLLHQARAIQSVLMSIRKDVPSGELRSRLDAAIDAHRALVEGLERQAVYLVSTMGAEARRRRSRLDILERVNSSLRLLGMSARQRGIDVELAIPAGLRTRPMFAAEMDVILGNLLSNAIKAVDHDGAIRISAESREKTLVVAIENSGTAVDIATSESWFEPFRSTTAQVDELLGQGLGLGLTLTRRIVDEYGGEIHFVTPHDGFSTRIEVTLPQ